MFEQGTGRVCFGDDLILAVICGKGGADAFVGVAGRGFEPGLFTMSAFATGVGSLTHWGSPGL